jgi:hypothetical protein
MVANVTLFTTVRDKQYTPNKGFKPNYSKHGNSNHDRDLKINAKKHQHHGKRTLSNTECTNTYW